MTEKEVPRGILLTKAKIRAEGSSFKLCRVLEASKTSKN